MYLTVILCDTATERGVEGLKHCVWFFKHFYN